MTILVQIQDSIDHRWPPRVTNIIINQEKKGKQENTALILIKKNDNERNTTKQTHKERKKERKKETHTHTQTKQTNEHTCFINLF